MTVLNFRHAIALAVVGLGGIVGCEPAPPVNPTDVNADTKTKMEQADKQAQDAEMSQPTE